MQKIVGSLIYETSTWSDVSHDVGLLSQFMQVPRKPHLDAACRVLHYAKSKMNHGLFYEHKVDVEVFGYANDTNLTIYAYDERSTIGYVFSFG